jgi:hypothetical protein
MKSGEILNVKKVIEAIKILRVKLLDILPKLPSNPLDRGKVLRELANEIVTQVGIDDYPTRVAVDALVEIFDKPYADSVYTAIMNDLEQLSRLKLQELRIELRSLYEIKIAVKLQRLPSDEFKQHLNVLKTMRFKFDDILKIWYKIYEAGKPIVHPLA